MTVSDEYLSSMSKAKQMLGQDTAAIDSLRQRRIEARRALWSRIKAEAPDNADFIEFMTKRYGKPEQVIVTLPTGEVLDSHRYDKKGGLD